MDRLYYQTLTVPAGTAITAAVSQAWELEDNQLEEVTIQIPDGHCGLTGVRIMQAQQQIVPFANDSYIVSNDRILTYPFKDQISSTGLVINGYNTDVYPHTFYCTALITNLPEPGETAPAEVVTAQTEQDQSLLTPDELTPESLLDQSDLENLTDNTNPPIPEPTPTPQPVTPTPTPKPVKHPVRKPVRHKVAGK